MSPIACFRKRDFSTAGKVYMRALETRESIFGRDTVKSESDLKRLAEIYLILDNFKAALDFSRRAIYASHDVDAIAGERQLIAYIAEPKASQQPKEAIKRLQASLAALRKNGGLKNQLVLVNLKMLGDLQSSVGDHAGACASHEELWSVYRELYGPDNMRTLNIQVSIVDDCMRQPDPASAAKHAEEVVSRLSKTAPNNKASLAAALFRSGPAQLAKGDLILAKQHLRQAIALYRDIPNEEIQRAHCLCYLGMVLRQLGEYDQADSALAESLTLYRINEESTQIDQITALLERAYAAESRGAYTQVHKFCEEAKAIAAESEKPNGPVYARIIHRMGVNAFNQGDTQGAISLLTEWRAIFNEAHRLRPGPHLRTDPSRDRHV